MTRKTDFTLNSEATPEIIDAYMSNWNSITPASKRITELARSKAAAYGKKNAKALNEICSDGPCKLDDIIEGMLGFAHGFADCAAYIGQLLLTDFPEL